MTISGINRTRQLLKDKAPTILKHYPVLFGYLFGSYARGEVHPFSDIDIGIYLENIPAREVIDNELSLALDIDDMLGTQIQCGRTLDKRYAAYDERKYSHRGNSYIF